MKKIITTLLLLIGANLATAQIRNADLHELPSMNGKNTRNPIVIPNFGDYQTLKCDFHIHTIFSDGQVWPDVRVHEAWQDGLDVIAITDHIEYRPYKDILKGDLNQSYKIAKETADQIGFILIKGIEITRAKPFGHMNALFISDANPIETPSALDAVDAAIKQGAFIMWNHPGWPDDKSTMYPEHEKLIAEGKIHGVEVFNEYEYYPVSFDWCNAHNLAYISNSDVHSTISNTYGTEHNARPITLVFATERSEAGVKEAMFARRTAALFNGTLAGPESMVAPLVKACLEVRKVTADRAEITNQSDIPFTLNDGKNALHLPSGRTIAVTIPSVAVNYTVENCFIGADRKLKISSSDLF